MYIYIYIYIYVTKHALLSLIMTTDYAKFRVVFSIYIKVMTEQIIHIQECLALLSE